MRRVARSLTTCVLCLFLCGVVSAAPSQPDSLYRDLPRDPLLVLGMSLNGPTAELGSLASILNRFRDISDDNSPNGRLPGGGVLSAFQLELLPLLGPELAIVVDLPPIDRLLETMQLSRDAGAAQILTDVGLVARVEDPEAVARLLGRGANTAARTGRLSFTFEAAEDSVGMSMELYYRIDNGRLALGFSPVWVDAAVKRRARGERLGDGEDFKRVFANLDSRPADLTYVNLPKLHSHLASSELVRLALRSNPELGEFFDSVMTEQAMAIGIGSSSVARGGGVRTTHFGPNWMSGTAVSSGFLAAMALPNLMTALERGRAERTSNDVLAIAQACEGFSFDSSRYPGPTQGWVPVEQISGHLEPVYIGRLPTTDGWQNPIMYWSDGGSFRVMSTGRDGAMDRDWSVSSDRRASSGPGGDIVFSDDGPVAWPVASGGR